MFVWILPKWIYLVQPGPVDCFHIPKCMCCDCCQRFSFIFWKVSELQPYKVAVTERSICSANISKLQVFTKTDVSYKWSDAQAQNLYHRVCHELRNGLLRKLFLLLLCISISKVKIHEETLIANNCIDVMWINGHNLRTIPLVHCNLMNISELLLLG